MTTPLILLILSSILLITMAAVGYLSTLKPMIDQVNGLQLSVSGERLLKALKDNATQWFENAEKNDAYILQASQKMEATVASEEVLAPARQRSTAMREEGKYWTLLTEHIDPTKTYMMSLAEVRQLLFR